MPDNKIEEFSPPADRRPRALLLILIGLFLVRWWLATLPGYPSDLNTYKRWALTAVRDGVHTIYDDAQTTYDYPPLYALILTPVGHAYRLVAPEAVESLFTPYFTTRQGGTGLGLAIVWRIAVAHGWQAWYVPRPGGGAVFRLDEIDARSGTNGPGG